MLATVVTTVNIYLPLGDRRNCTTAYITATAGNKFYTPPETA